MKVLMFGWEFPPHISGGLGTACFGLTKGLAVHDVQIKFVVPKVYGDEDQNNVRLINASDVYLKFNEKQFLDYWKNISFLEIDSVLVPYITTEEYYNIISNYIKDKTSLRDSIFFQKYNFSGKYGNDLMAEVSRYAMIAASIALDNEFDIIHAHDWLTYPAGIAAKEISGKPLVIHVHATEFDRSGENINQYVYDIERRGMEAADKIITVSNFTRNIVINRYGINPDKVITVYNAVEPINNDDIKEYKKTVKEKVVTFLGRVTFQKGPEYFVEAAKKVLEKDNNVRFVMAGSGDMLNRMIRYAAKLGIATKFHFTGFLKGDDVINMFSISDVYVMPSVSEPFGISPLEAMRSNVPVVISKQSGVSEVLKYAIKVDFWDINALADSIYGLINYNALSNMFVRLGKDEVDNLRWENSALEIKKIYESILK